METLEPPPSLDGSRGAYIIPPVPGGNGNWADPGIITLAAPRVGGGRPAELGR